MAYLDMFNRLRKDWPEANRTVCGLAARFYLGIDSLEDLERQSKPLIGWSSIAPISGREKQGILNVKDNYIGH